MNLNGTIKKTQALTGRLVKSSGGGGSVQEIYWVQYGVGTATNAEVNTAIAANKLPICYWDSTNASGQTTRRLYFLIRHTPTEALFATVDSTNETILVRRLYADAWNTQTIRYEGKLTWDTTPRFGSANPVTSGGIYNAIQNATVSDERIAEAVDDWLSVQAPSIGTLSYAAKQALLACFRHVAWIDDQGQSYYNALESELFPDATLESITAVFTQGSAVIYDTDSLDTLRQYLVVTATYSDSTTAVVTDYTLSGTLAAGTSIITVSYGGKNTTFSVLCESILYPLANGSFTFSGNYNQKITISNGRHIKVEYPIGDSFANGSIINLSSLSNNGSTSTIDSNGSAVNNLSSILFTIPANSNIELAIENLNHTRSEMLSTNGSQFLLNFRKTGASASIIGAVGFHANTADDKMIATGTIDAQTSASCLFLYEQRVLSGITVEFDISLRVNGVKWI